MHTALRNWKLGSGAKAGIDPKQVRVPAYLPDVPEVREEITNYLASVQEMDAASRTGVDDVKALCGIMIQADKFGSSIAQALRVQSDSMRTRRRQLAEEKAAKTAVKLIFPLVIFIFPGIFVVLVGPAAILWVNNMAPTMSAS